MKIEDLQETAALAHLNMGEKELAAAFPAFEQMLGYFAAMQAADRDETVKEAAAVRTVDAGFFRPDNAIQNNIHTDVSNTLPENLINNAGDRDGRFVVVPNVL
ncbi:MAG: aspartyl/glutamyl-tRNA amidotransferase subunit C [Treponema sp.]|jgi:aspartyl-tRNA(Asn)/glutamyl-tRNA(Gln) amidotransferase subunit C|nr:aspartyl/glutamyl-tRNA amidotransferase subunit C [Treponema sp.]